MEVHNRVFVITKEEIESRNYERFIRVFKKLEGKKEEKENTYLFFEAEMSEDLELEENYRLESYLVGLVEAVPYLFYFLEAKSDSSTAALFAYLLSEKRSVLEDPTGKASYLFNSFPKRLRDKIRKDLLAYSFYYKEKVNDLRIFSYI